MTTTEIKLHEWEPTDTQGHAMECVNCGKFISIHDAERWDKSLKEECPKKSQ